MKQKLIALAVAGVLTAPMMAQADVAVSGDARVRYQSTTMDANGANEQAVSNSRIGINIEGNDGYVAKVHARLEITHTPGDLDNENKSTFSNAISVDWAWAEVNAMGLNISGGVMPATWGIGLVTNDAEPNRIKIAKKFGDLSAALIFDKVNEVNSLGGVTPDNADDNSAMRVLAVKPLGENTKAGLIISSLDDKGTTSTAIDAFYTSPMVSVEIAKPEDGMILGVLAPIPAGDNIGLTAVLVHSMDDAGASDNFFTAFTTVDQGVVPFSGFGSTDGETATAVGLLGGMGEFGFGVAQLMSSNDSLDNTLAEVSYTKKLSDMTQFKAYAGTVTDMVSSAYGANIETKF